MSYSYTQKIKTINRLPDVQQAAPEQTENLLDLFQKLEICDATWQLLPPYDKLQPEIGPIDLTDILSTRIGPEEEDTLGSLILFLEKKLSKKAKQPVTFYLRGSSARKKIDQTLLLDNLIKQLCSQMPRHALRIQAAWEQMKPSLPAAQDPRDLDLIALTDTPCDEVLESLKTKMHFWLWTHYPHLKAKPEMMQSNMLNRAAESLIITKLGPEIDLAVGHQKRIKRLFSLDAQGIKIMPSKTGSIHSFQDNCFQSALDATFKIIRLEKQHTEDAYAYLAVVQNEMIGGTIVNKETSYEECAGRFINSAPTNDLLHAIKKRAVDKQIDLFSFTFNVLVKSPPSQQRETLWNAYKQQNSVPAFLESDSSFEQLAQELYYFSKTCPDHPLLNDLKLIFPPEYHAKRDQNICRELRRTLLQCAQDYASSNTFPVEGSPYKLISSLRNPQHEDLFNILSTSQIITEQELPEDIKFLFRTFPVERDKCLLTLIENQRFQSQAIALWKELHPEHSPEQKLLILAPHLSEKVIDKELTVLPHLSINLLLELKEKPNLHHYKKALLALNRNERHEWFRSVPNHFWKDLLTDPMLFDKGKDLHFIETLLKECPSHKLFWALEMQGFAISKDTSSLFAHHPEKIRQAPLIGRLHWLLSQHRFEEFISLFPHLQDPQFFPFQAIRKVLQEAPSDLSLSFFELLDRKKHPISSLADPREELLLRLDDQTLFKYLTGKQEPEKIRDIALRIIASPRFNLKQNKAIAYTLLNAAPEARRAELFFSNMQIIPPSSKIYSLLPKSTPSWERLGEYITWLSEAGLSEPALDLLLTHQKELSTACIRKVISQCASPNLLPKIVLVERNDVKEIICTRVKNELLKLYSAQRANLISTYPQWLQEELLFDTDILCEDEAKPYLTSLLQKSKRMGLQWKMEERYGAQTCESVLNETTSEEEFTVRLDYLLQRNRYNDYLDLAKKMPNLFNDMAQRALDRAQNMKDLRGVKQVVARSQLVPHPQWLANTALNISDERDTPLFLDLLRNPQLKKSIPDLLTNALDLPAIENYNEQYSQLILTHLDSISNITLVRRFLEKAPLSITLNKEQSKRLFEMTENDCEASLAFMHFLHLRKLPQRASLSPAIIEYVERNPERVNEETAHIILLASAEAIAKISPSLLSTIATSGNAELLKAWMQKTPHIKTVHLEKVKNHHALLLLMIEHYNILNIEPYLDSLLNQPNLSYEEWLQLKPRLYSIKSLRIEQLALIFHKWKEEGESFFTELHKRAPEHFCCQQIIQDHLAQNDWKWFLDKPEIVNKLESPHKESIAELCLRHLLRSALDPKAIEKFYRIKSLPELTDLFDVLQVLIKTETVNEPLLEEVLNQILKKRLEGSFLACFQKFAETGLTQRVLDSSRIKSKKLLLIIQLMINESIKKTNDPITLEISSRWLLNNHFPLPWNDLISSLERNSEISDAFLILLFNQTCRLKTNEEHLFMYHLAGKRQTIGYDKCDFLSLLFFLNKAFNNKLPHSIYKGLDQVLSNPLLRNGRPLPSFLLAQLQETPAPTLQQILAVLDGANDDEDLRTKFFQLFARLMLFKISPETLLEIKDEDNLDTIYDRLKQLIIINNLQDLTTEYLANVLNTPDCLSTQLRLGNVTELYIRLLGRLLDSPESNARYSHILLLLIENVCRQPYCNKQVLKLLVRSFFETWNQKIPPTVNRIDLLLSQFIVLGTFKDIKPNRDEALHILNKLVEICRPHRTRFHTKKIYLCIQYAHQLKLEEKLIQKWLQIAKAQENQLVDTDKHYLAKFKERISKGDARLTALLKTKRK